MKKRKMIWITIIAVFVILSNTVPPLNNIIRIIGEGNLYDFDHYITLDKKLATSSIQIYDTTISNNEYYWAYRRTYPNVDSTLYRIEPILFYRFWRWAEYIYDPHWQQPYMEMSIQEHHIVFKQMWKNREKYGTPFPRDSTTQTKK